MSTNAKKRKSLRERRKIQRRKLQIRAAAALLSLVAVTFLLIFHFTPQNTQADSEPKAPTYKYLLLLMERRRRFAALATSSRSVPRTYLSRVILVFFPLVRS